MELGRIDVVVFVHEAVPKAGARRQALRERGLEDTEATEFDTRAAADPGPAIAD